MARQDNLVIRYFRLLLGSFFRRIEVTGVENVPADAGGVAVSWHPNGAIDGAVLMTTFPRRIVFGARHGLLEIPLLGWLMRRCGTVPIYRRQDASGAGSTDDRQARNRASVDALAGAVAEGDFAALFPEGRSHDEPFVQELKVGAAHLYYRAVEMTPPDRPAPVIVPVGLHYSRKRLWGSRLLVAFHPPLELAAELREPRAAGPARNDQARRLTETLDHVLRETVLATESWQIHNLFQRARKLINAERHARRGEKSVAPDMAERVRQFGRIWVHYHQAVARYPVETMRLLDSVAFYDRCLRALGVDDHELDGAAWKVSWRRTLLVALEFLVIYLVLPLFLLIGILVNLPTMLLLQAVTRLASRKSKDEASIKVCLGAVLFPLTWLIAAGLAAWGGGLVAAAYPQVRYSSLLTFAAAFLLSAFGGLLALHFRQLATEVLRTLRVRLTLSRRHGAVEWLLEERAGLFDRLMELEGRLSGTRHATTETGR